MAKSSSCHSAQIIFPLHAIHICSRVFPTQVQVTGANQEGSLFRGSALCAPGWHTRPFKAPAAVASFSPGVDGLCTAGLPSGSGSTFQAPVHSASFIQSARHGGGPPQPLSHFHGQPWNWKINKHTLPLQGLLTLFLENGGCLGTSELTSVCFYWLHVTLRVNSGDSCAQRLFPPFTLCYSFQNALLYMKEQKSLISLTKLKLFLSLQKKKKKVTFNLTLSQVIQNWIFYFEDIALSYNDL